MPKTPDETKKGIKCCHINDVDLCDCEFCPYAHKGWQTAGCDITMAEDALALIQQLEAQNAEKAERIKQLEAQNAEKAERIKQLEAERDELMRWAKGRCDTCAHKDDCVKHDPDPEGYVMSWYDDCEIWEWRGVTKEESQ